MSGHDRNTGDAPALRLLFWESTSGCNLSCAHCRRLNVSSKADAAGELSTESACRVFESATKLGRPVIVFSGGEPLLRPDWPELAAYAKSLGLPTAMATNGTLIDQPMAARIAAAGFHRVSVSLDGADAATHDPFRGVAGAFDKALAGIAALRHAGVPVQINVSIAAHNIAQLDSLHDLCVSVGAVAMHLFMLVPVGCGAQIKQTHELSPEQYEQALNWVCDRQLSGNIEIRATCAPHYYRIASQRGLSLRPGSRGCLAGAGVIFVSSRGEVFPCGYFPISCGNVLNESLENIWITSSVLNDLRDPSRLQGKCGACEFNILCGGCRARAYAQNENFFSADTACIYGCRQ
jgi:AdoMet-dependent heme synthase